MSIIETLTEGIVNRDMKKEGHALLSKWGKTGLLEGLQTEHEKSTMGGSSLKNLVGDMASNPSHKLLNEPSASALLQLK